MKPIIQYKNDKQLQKSLKEWQKRLFLDSWIIHVRLCDKNQISNEEEGHIDFYVENKTASILILQEDKESRIEKFCQELTLVHELLHLKMGWLKSPETMEGKYYEVLQHQLIEEMAKSLIMAKYNLKLNWFKDF